MGKETGMLHVTPRARNGQRAKVAAKGVWRQDGSKWDDKPTHTPVAHACRMTYQPARGAVSRQNRRRRTLVYALSSLYAGSKEEARADKEKDRDTQQSGGNLSPARNRKLSKYVKEFGCPRRQLLKATPAPTFSFWLCVSVRSSRVSTEQCTSRSALQRRYGVCLSRAAPVATAAYDEKD